MSHGRHESRSRTTDCPTLTNLDYIHASVGTRFVLQSCEINRLTKGRREPFHRLMKIKGDSTLDSVSSTALLGSHVSRQLEVCQEEKNLIMQEADQIMQSCSDHIRRECVIYTRLSEQQEFIECRIRGKFVRYDGSGICPHCSVRDRVLVGRERLRSRGATQDDKKPSGEN